MNSAVVVGLEENAKPIKILTVEDDIPFQESLIFSLSSRRSIAPYIKILRANSATQASFVLNDNPDIALAFIDVVLEREDSGLQLVKMIRNTLNNQTIRLVLLTGQPGMAPREDIMARYDIDDYWCKSDLKAEFLETIILSHLRTWTKLRSLSATA